MTVLAGPPLDRAVKPFPQIAVAHRQVQILPTAHVKEVRIVPVHVAQAIQIAEKAADHLSALRRRPAVAVGRGVAGVQAHRKYSVEPGHYQASELVILLVNYNH